MIRSLGRRSSGWAALVLILLAGCGVSPKQRAQISSAINTFVSQWKQDDLDGIYNNADPQFRKTQNLDDWQTWTRTVQQHWGPLRSVEIVNIDRLAPTVDLYEADTIMKYANGNTRGRLSFNLHGGPPRLIGAILANAEDRQSR